jgi:hypothetical protein
MAMVKANLLGAITATKVFLEQLKDGGGDLVNISSVAGRTARPTNGVYAATKWGINGWCPSPTPGRTAGRLSSRRNTNRALLTGRCGLANSGEFSARPSRLVTTKSMRSSRIQAGASVIAPRNRCRLGRT